MDWTILFESFFSAVFSNGASLVVSVVTNIISMTIMYGLIVTLVNERIYYRKTEKSMQEVDQFEMLLHKYLTSHYLTLAKDYLGKDYYNHIESYLYLFLVEKPLEEIKNEFRRRVRKNGFEKKSTKDWMHYVDDCIEEDHAKFTMGLNKVYFRNSILPIVKLYDHNQSIKDTVNKEYKELFEKLLEIANTNKYRKFFKWEIRFHF